MVDDSNSDFSIQVCSDIDYEELIAEIYFRDEFVALISQKDGPDKLRIEFPNTQDNTTDLLRLDLASFLEAVASAKQKLVGYIS